jgi:MYXO-CTERM domain-containing protein
MSRWFAYLTAVALAGAACDAAIPALDSETRPIVDGVVNEYDRGVVALTDDGFAFCSGTLVSPRVVVTAAHCVDDMDFERVRIHVGGRVGLGASIPVTYGKVHEQYDGASDDLAMLLLESPAPARSWPLSTTPFDDSFLGLPVRIAGFGRTSEDGGADGQRREGMATISTYDPLDFRFAKDPSMTCFGDSGGPGFMTIDGTEYLVGVTSRVVSPYCQATGIDTRVDVYQVWIQFFIDLNDMTVTDCGADGTCALDCDAPDPDCPCEADGYCSIACPTLNKDRDCPLHCDHDGTCELEDGCPVEDLDCNPTAGVGDRCAFDTDCVEGACVEAVEDDRVTYCSTPCGTDADCPADLVCTDSTCHYEPPSPGAQGWPCTADDECVESHCVPEAEGSSNRICADGCVSDSDCSDGSVCGRNPLDEAQKLCLPESGGGCGCEAGGSETGTARQLPQLVLLLLAALAMRRGRRRPA